MVMLSMDTLASFARPRAINNPAQTATSMHVNINFEMHAEKFIIKQSTCTT
jgi:hypothetical protein